MTVVRVRAYECDGCGLTEPSVALPVKWRARWYGGTSVQMHFCPKCVKARLDARLSRGNPYDSSADALSTITARRRDRRAPDGKAAA